MLRLVYSGFHKVYTRLHGGKNYEIVDRGDAVNVLVVRKGSKLSKDTLMLGTQYRAGADEVMYTNVAGMIDAGESPGDAAIRESIEEMGVKGDLYFLGTQMPSPGGSTEKIHFYAMMVKELGEATDKSEGITMVNMPFKVAKKKQFLSMQLNTSITLYKKFRKQGGVR